MGIVCEENNEDLREIVCSLEEAGVRVHTSTGLAGLVKQYCPLPMLKTNTGMNYYGVEELREYTQRVCEQRRE